MRIRVFGISFLITSPQPRAAPSTKEVLGTRRISVSCCHSPSAHALSVPSCYTLPAVALIPPAPTLDSNVLKGREHVSFTPGTLLTIYLRHLVVGWTGGFTRLEEQELCLGLALGALV